MPELPDLTVYRERLAALLVAKPLEAIRLAHPFFLRSVDPPVDALVGKRVTSVCLLGKRIVFGFEEELYAALHLMIAGRLHWRTDRRPIPRKTGLARLDFPDGSLLVTEAGTKRRASLLVVRGQKELRRIDPGGIAVAAADFEEFARTLRRENHTLKRALTDPRLFAGIGNAYSDEMLHRARLSPFRQTRHCSTEEIVRLHNACRSVLDEWIGRLRTEAGGAMPKRVTAFHPRMAVHGKYGKPCPECGNGVQRIRYAENECNYCPTCQTGGRLLADRALSRLLKSDWPKTVEELEEMKRPAGR